MAKNEKISVHKELNVLYDSTYIDLHVDHVIRKNTA